jgi:hypothetical protein
VVGLFKLKYLVELFFFTKLKAWAPFAEGKNNLFNDETLKEVGNIVQPAYA